MVDVDKVLRNVIKKGKVVLGAKQVIKSAQDGTAKVIVVSSNCPYESKQEIGMDNFIEYDGNGVELGTACGKPFSISALAVLEADETDIVALRGLQT
jgi:large subunit ribosomal protein L30e